MVSSDLRKVSFGFIHDYKFTDYKFVNLQVAAGRVVNRLNTM